MIRDAIGEASTIEEARERARQQLNAPDDADVTFEIVAMPQKKVLGLFGGSPARVKAVYDDGKREPKPKKPKSPQPPKAPEQKAAPQQKKAQEKPAPEQKATPKKEAKKHPAQKPEYAPDEPVPAVDPQPVVDYLKSILAGLDISEASISAKQENSTIVVEIQCADYGIIIGRRGETLDAIQYLCSLVINRTTEKYMRVSLNVGNYREKRKDTLRAIAKKNAGQVLRTGRRYTFEPMNPYERRIIHTAIQEVEGVTSRSIGTNGERKVVLELEAGTKPQKPRSEGNGNRRPSQGGNGGNRPRRQPQEENSGRPAQKKNAAPPSEKPEKPKFGKIE